MATLEKLLGDFLSPSNTISEAKLEKSYYGKAQRLAKKLGLSITIDNIYQGFGEPVAKGQWIEGTGQEDGNFSSSWEECYNNLKSMQNES